MSAGRTSRVPAAPACRGPAAGFTLLELIVALTIAGVVVTTVHLAIGAAMDASDRNRAVQEAARRDRNARMVLTSLLRTASADPPPGIGIEDPGRASARLRLSTVAPVRLGAVPAGEPVTARLGLVERGALLTLASRIDPARTDSLLLFAGVEALEFRFHDPEAADWLPSWERTDALPTGVAVGFVADRPIPAVIVHFPVRATGSPPAAGRRPSVGDRVGGAR